MAAPTLLYLETIFSNNTVALRFNIIVGVLQTAGAGSNCANRAADHWAGSGDDGMRSKFGIPDVGLNEAEDGRDIADMLARNCASDVITGVNKPYPDH